MKSLTCKPIPWNTKLLFNESASITNMCILSAIGIAVCSTFVLKILWIIKMGTLAHWSFIVGSAVYPEDMHGNLVLSTSLFAFILFGSIIPAFLCPKLKFVATALSIPPQIHMFLLLQRNVSARLKSKTVSNTIKGYTAVTLISTLCTIYSLWWWLNKLRTDWWCATKPCHMRKLVQNRKRDPFEQLDPWNHFFREFMI